MGRWWKHRAAGRLAHLDTSPPAAPVVRDGTGPSSGGHRGGPHLTAPWGLMLPNWGSSPVFLNGGCRQSEGSVICHSDCLSWEHAKGRGQGCRTFWKMCNQSHPAPCDTFEYVATQPNHKHIDRVRVQTCCGVSAHTGWCRDASSLQLSGKMGSIFFGTLQKASHHVRKAVALMSMLIKPGAEANWRGLLSWGGGESAH